MAGAAEIGDESAHHRRGDSSFKREDLGDNASVLGLEPVGEPTGADVEEPVAVGQS